MNQRRNLAAEFKTRIKRINLAAQGEGEARADSCVQVGPHPDQTGDRKKVMARLGTSGLRSKLR